MMLSIDIMVNWLLPDAMCYVQWHWHWWWGGFGDYIYPFHLLVIIHDIWFCDISASRWRWAPLAAPGKIVAAKMEAGAISSSLAFSSKRAHMLFLSVWIHTVLNSAPGIAFLGRSSSTAPFSLGKLHGNAFNSIFRQKVTVFGTRCDADAGIEEFSASFSKRSTAASYLSSPIILGSRIVCCQDKFLCGRQERRVGRGGNPSFWRLAGGQVHSGGYPLSGSELNFNGSGVFYQRVGHHNPSGGGFG